MAESARRILVVEDEDAVRGMVARHLSQSGYEVSQASDAEQVMLRMSRDREPFDLVLSDIHLPGLSGVELLRLLLAHSPLRPVIMITGDADERLARRALKYGAAGYLLKPFELFELEAAVQQAVSRLQLVEAAESLARSYVAERPGGSEHRAHIPAAWLELADRRCGAGVGHGHRVARLAEVIASNLAVPLAEEERRALELAARSHELGRLLGPATPTELAGRTAQLLYDLGVESRVLRIINHLRERWDGVGEPNGIGGPDIPAASLVLAAADAADHGAVKALADGADPFAAIATAVTGVRTGAAARYGPSVAAAVDSAARVLEAVWVLARGSSGDDDGPGGGLA